MTKQQVIYYKAIKRYIDQNACSPSYEEIGKMVGVKSLATVHHMIGRLVRAGYLVTVKGHGRSVNIIPHKLHGFNKCDRYHVEIYFQTDTCPLCEELQKHSPAREILNSSSTG